MTLQGSHKTFTTLFGLRWFKTIEKCGTTLEYNKCIGEAGNNTTFYLPCNLLTFLVLVWYQTI